MNKKKIIAILLIVIITIATLVVIEKYNADDGKYVAYNNFHSYVEKGEIKHVSIENDRVLFLMQNDENEYYTDNPDYDMFKEFLLQNGVTIESSDSTSELLVNISDVIFNLIFVVIIISLIFKVLGYFKNSFKIVKKEKSKFSDIAGMDNLKKDMLQAVDILKNPDVYAAKGIRQPNGILLIGDPGNGKTMFARALAGEANVNFIATKATDFQSALMSVGPTKIKLLFKKARANKPCIVFIDEFDGIGEKRNYSGTGIDKENNRMITALLNEMDGFTRKTGVMVIAATNHYQTLDEALVRAGRFDMKFVIPFPDLDTRRKLIEIYTQNKQLESEA
ncbi:MAG: 26S protease regulatory subunit, partial [Sedimentibacter sp.]